MHNSDETPKKRSTLDDFGCDTNDPPPPAAMGHYDPVWWLDYYEDYLRTVEEFLRKEAVSLREKYHEMESAIGGSSNVEEHLDAVQHFFPSLLRSSLFLAVYSCFDGAMKHTCDLVQEQRHCPTGVDGEKKGSDLEKYNRYLRRIAGVQLDRLAGWTDLTDYAKVRNCVVHYEGHLDCKRDASQYLIKQYIPRKSSLSVACGFYGPQIQFNQGFCEEVICTVRGFMDELNVGQWVKGYSVEPTE
jgi:hypothetical protein